MSEEITKGNGCAPSDGGWLNKILKRLTLEGLSIFQEYFLFVPHPPGIKSIKSPKEYGLEGMVTRCASDGRIPLWYKESSHPSKPVYVVFHGNTGHWGDSGRKDDHDHEYRIKLLNRIAAEGAGVVAVHLRGYGLSQGVPSEKAFRRDVDAVIQWLDKEKIAPSRIVVLGESMGAAVAAITAERLTARKTPPAVLGMVASFSSMAERAHDEHPEFKTEELSKKLRHHFRNTQAMQNVAPSTYIYIGHAPNDTHTSCTHSQRLYEAAMSVPARNNNGRSVYLMPLDGDHSSWNPQEIVDDTMHLYDKSRDANRGVTSQPSR